MHLMTSIREMGEKKSIKPKGSAKYAKKQQV